MIYVFDRYELDLDRYELRCAGSPLSIQPKVFDTLAYLVQHHERTITKEALFEHVWPEQIVSEASLTYCVSLARHAIGDNGQAQQFIKTVFGRGYRFVASVDVRSPSRPATKPPTLPAASEPLTTIVPPMPAPAPVPNDAVVEAASRPKAERRQITILSSRVVFTSVDTAPIEPEELHQAMQDSQAVCTRIVQPSQGYLAHYSNTELAIYFGYPKAREDDAPRAVRAGLSLVEAFAQLNQELAQTTRVRVGIYIGIDTGLVVINEMSRSDQREQLALGETPLIAAQLHTVAAMNHVVVSAATHRLIDGYFLCQPTGTQHLENLTQAVEAYQVLQAQPVQRRFELALASGLTPLVGRAHETGLLQERWQQAKDGAGQVVLLSGEAGMGKSRLVQVLKEHVMADAPTWIECRGWPPAQNSALYPLLSALKEWLHWRQTDTPELKLRKLEEVLDTPQLNMIDSLSRFAALLSIELPGDAPIPTVNAQPHKQQLWELLLAWLRATAAQQPIVFIVEDLHWVDPSTQEWLSLLIDRLPTMPMLIVLTFRPDFAPPWGFPSYITHLALSPLPPHQVDLMLQQLTAARKLPADVFQLVAAKTDGVPLFVEELTKMILEAHPIEDPVQPGEYRTACPPLAIPPTLQDYLMARLDRLGVEIREVVQLCALIGREFLVDVLAAIAPYDEPTLQHALDQLVNTEFLYQRVVAGQTYYVFKHALIQDTAYQSMLRRTRQQYHQQVAQLIETRFPELRLTQPERLAYHYLQAGLTQPAPKLP